MSHLFNMSDQTNAVIVSIATKNHLNILLSKSIFILLDNLSFISTVLFSPQFPSKPTCVQSCKAFTFIQLFS